MSPLKHHKGLRVLRRTEVLLNDDRRVILRYLDFHRPRRIQAIARRVRDLPRRRVAPLMRDILKNFSPRHRDLPAAFEEHFQRVAPHLGDAEEIPAPRRRLIGAYFTSEYSIESAALFNPSITAHPDQSHLPAGAVRFLMSLRAVGEGHVSSIVFRRGVIDARGAIRFDPPPRWSYTARPAADAPLAKDFLLEKARENDLNEALVSVALEDLPDPLTMPKLAAAVNAVGRSIHRPPGFKRFATALLRLAGANYDLSFPQDCRPAEIVIFPATARESRGMEDLRLVHFRHDSGRACYYGTYTAYDGFSTQPMLLETENFHDFNIRTLAGRYAGEKGMALFPRTIGGAYCMLARHDHESLFLLRSGDLNVWNHSTKLIAPVEAWEATQLGNCGSPIETDAGWLVITHGVGPMRQYCIGAALLDREHPQKVIGRLRRPLMTPRASEREGYVPNVLYTCGSIVHRGRLVIPYAMSDARTGFATLSLRSLLQHLLDAGP